MPRAMSAQDTLYADPQHRFTIRVPEAWTRRELGDEGVIFHGPGLALQVIPMAESGSPRLTLAALKQLIDRSWRDLQEVDRQEVLATGQKTAWVVYNGTDFAGTPGTVRVIGVEGGGARVGVIVNGERTHYTAQRGTIEAILATLRLGANLPSSYRTYASQPRDSVAQSLDSASSPALPPIGIGLAITDLTADVEQVDPDDGGVLVDRVEIRGPADQAGIREGDIILELDRTPLEEPADFDRLLAAHESGDSIDLLIERKGRKRRISVRLEAGH